MRPIIVTGMQRSFTLEELEACLQDYGTAAAASPNPRQNVDVDIEH